MKVNDITNKQSCNMQPRPQMPTTLNNWHKHQIKRREKVKLKKDDREKKTHNKT